MQAFAHFCFSCLFLGFLYLCAYSFVDACVFFGGKRCRFFVQNNGGWHVGNSLDGICQGFKRGGEQTLFIVFFCLFSILAFFFCFFCFFRFFSWRFSDLRWKIFGRKEFLGLTPIFP